MFGTTFYPKLPTARQILLWAHMRQDHCQTICMYKYDIDVSNLHVYKCEFQKKPLMAVELTLFWCSTS